LRLVDKLKQCGTRTMLLDATEAGAKLYRRFGFVETDRVGVYRGRATQSALSWPRFAGTVQSSELGLALAEVAGLDRRVFGCDRRRLLERFVQEVDCPVAIARDRSEEICGYALLRKATLGPWVATSPAAAGALLGALEVCAAPTSAFVPQSNAAATALADSLGLLLDRSLAHMVWGAASPIRRDWLYGQASLGTG
ncbi:MAG: hypothetical protein M3T49_08610, partial [Candidatus Eremiobacteraeota bacterium]|nr:hypothetical protein [Candidatus Eremiobacteraeota bacterium]